jgi:hypothetical protein
MRSTPNAARTLLLILLVGITARCSEPAGLDRRDCDELLGYARDTWRSVAEMAKPGELPADGLRHQPDGTWRPSRKSTPTDIGCYLWSVVAAERLKLISADEAERRLARTLEAIGRLERVHGFFYDKIDPQTGVKMKSYPHGGAPISPIASPVDNSWLATGLIMARNAFPSLRKRVDVLLAPMDLGFFYVAYDPSDSRNHPGQIHGPYFVDKKSFGGFHRLLNTEQRISCYIGVSRGQLPAEFYYRIERTLKGGEQDQSQTPAGEFRTYRGIPVFEGHYRYRGTRFVPSWGGSMFEALMVTLFVPEERWAPRSWGVNHPLYVRGQIEHGLKEASYGYWGFSPSCDPEGDYEPYGVSALGSDPVGYPSGNDTLRPDPGPGAPKRRYKNGVVTPHASFLALRFAPREAMQNLRKLKAKFPIYGDHGFLDSVNVSNGVVADRVLMLDQGMVMAAIANAVACDAMRKAFIDAKTEQILRPLIAMEEFTAGPAPAELSHMEFGNSCDRSSPPFP